MAARDRRPAVDVDPRQRPVVRPHLTGQDEDAVRDQAGQRRLHVEDLEFGRAPRSLGADPSPVGLLTAALGVEGRGVENQFELVALARLPASRPSAPMRAVTRASRATSR